MAATDADSGAHDEHDLNAWRRIGFDWLQAQRAFSLGRKDRVEIPVDKSEAVGNQEVGVEWAMEFRGHRA